MQFGGATYIHHILISHINTHTHTHSTNMPGSLLLRDAGQKTFKRVLILHKKVKPLQSCAQAHGIPVALWLKVWQQKCKGTSIATTATQVVKISLSITSAEQGCKNICHTLVTVCFEELDSCCR